MLKWEKISNFQSTISSFNGYGIMPPSFCSRSKRKSFAYMKAKKYPISVPNKYFKSVRTCLGASTSLLLLYIRKRDFFFFTSIFLSKWIKNSKGRREKTVVTCCCLLHPPKVAFQTYPLKCKRFHLKRKLNTFILRLTVEPLSIIFFHLVFYVIE